VRRKEEQEASSSSKWREEAQEGGGRFLAEGGGPRRTWSAPVSAGNFQKGQGSSGTREKRAHVQAGSRDFCFFFWIGNYCIFCF
jgi:hypothetical protein